MHRLVNISIHVQILLLNDELYKTYCNIIGTTHTTVAARCLYFTALEPELKLISINNKLLHRLRSIIILKKTLRI